MKRQAIAILGIVSLLTIGLLSISGADHSSMHSHQSTADCVAVQTQGAVCPEAQTDPFGFAAFHLTSFRGVSDALVDFGVSQLLMVAALFAALLAVAFSPAEISVFSPECRYFTRRRSYLPLFIRRVLSWQALHQISPTHF